MKGIQGIIFISVMLAVALSIPNYWEDKTFVSKESSEEGQGSGPKETSCPCGWTNKGRIVGGKETLPNEFPLMAGLVYVPTEFLFCGATIITPHHALTAVHCTIAYTGIQIHLSVGGHKLKEEKEKQTNEALYPIDQIFEHEDYNDMTLANDIALVTVNGIIEFSKKVGPACLPDKAINMVDEHVKVLGWGVTSDGGQMSNVLLKVNLKVVPTKECYETHRIDIGSPDAENVICTFRFEKDSCNGDSGGPVIWKDPETNRFTLVGIVSHGKACGDKEDPAAAINANVTHFMPWIQEKIVLSGFPEKTCSKK